jgi:ATP-dependent Clp protease protease subunit
VTIHVIHFMGSINQATAGQLQDLTLKALTSGASELRYHMSTDGGSTGYAFALYNLIRSLPIPVTMHNVGNVESMGNILYLAADNRLAGPHSRFLIHPLNWGFAAGVTIDHARLNEHSASLDNDFERYVNIFNERTEGASEQIDIRSCLKNSARVLTAESATASRLATRIENAALPADAVTWWVNA